jgi:hypothetical protein
LTEKQKRKKEKQQIKDLLSSRDIESLPLADKYEMVRHNLRVIRKMGDPHSYKKMKEYVQKAEASRPTSAKKESKNDLPTIKEEKVAETLGI